MRIVTLEDIAPIVADKAGVIDAVKRGFIAHDRGSVALPAPTQMVFYENGQQIRGDCHVKTAYSEAYPYFCVKIATGFYNNADKGLPVNDGLVLLLSSDTGAPLALFQDRGHLTSARTAAAGALAAGLVGGGDAKKLGIAGTGHQAELQARWICAHTTISEVFVWGRSRTSANAWAARVCDLSVDITVVDTPSDLCAQADVIVTATPSTEPIICSNSVRAGHRIIALGADSPGKVELEPQILARAKQIITDDREQCLHHGEYGHAVRSGALTSNCDLSLGACLADPQRVDRGPKAITVVDLTGLGAQDLALASMVWDRLNINPLTQ